MKFGCPRCHIAVPYGEGARHVGECYTAIEKCPILCGATGLKTSDQFNAHLTECKNLIRKCSCCPTNSFMAVMWDEDFLCPQKLLGKEAVNVDSLHKLLADVSKDF